MRTACAPTIEAGRRDTTPEARVKQAHDRGTPTYEGRPLARPDEEVVDQGLGFDVATSMGRRRMLLVPRLGAVGSGWPRA